MKPRFQPEFELALDSPSLTDRTDPEAVGLESYDASEQGFAASLEENREQNASAEPAAPKFVVQPESSNQVDREIPHTSDSKGPQADLAAMPVSPEVLQPEDPDAWKREVSARVSQYRRRRPKEPRYPSLMLKFEPSQQDWRASVPSAAASMTTTHQALAMESVPVEEPITEEVHAENPRTAPSLRSALGESETAKIIEFPRFGIAPPSPLDELAEPVFRRPRIIEVPEVEPPPPAMGGILIEPAEEFEEEKRPGFEIPLQPARMSRRLLAAATDALIVLCAVAGFAYLFFRMTQTIPAIPQALAFGGVVTAIFWAGYHYLFIVHGGTTPGLRLARLRISRFDGGPVPRSLRRWRVLASILSGISLGLGYAWCFLDEDQLCWHDRATHTYLAPSIPNSVE